MSSFISQSQLAEDRELLKRVAACAASMGVANPLGWAFDHAWELAVTPGWADTAVDESGRGASRLITDDMIRAAVTTLTQAPEEPEVSEEEE